MPLTKLIAPSPAPSFLQAIHCTKKFSWASELRHLLSTKTLNVCWWPVFMFRQRKLTYSALFRECAELPGFKALWQTIQKGSFAYNRLFLKLPLFRQNKETDIADILTLLLFFGDEFIDGVSCEAGNKFILEILDGKNRKAEMKIKIIDEKPQVYFLFSMEELLPASILEKKNKKYNTSYRNLIHLLHRLQDMLNTCLGKIPGKLGYKAAVKITEAVNTCLESYLNDLKSNARSEKIISPAAVLEFHELKTAFMQTRLLELRCLLTKKESLLTSVQMQGWLDVMRVVQIFDDIQDIVVDDGFQDNYVISVAAIFFPEEWNWFVQNRENLQKKESLQLLSVQMPRTFEHCFRLAATKINSMNWEQQKIMHYVIFRAGYELFSFAAEKNKDFLDKIYTQIKINLGEENEGRASVLALETCMLVPAFRKKILSLADITFSYLLHYNLFIIPDEEKIIMFKRLRKKLT